VRKIIRFEALEDDEAAQVEAVVEEVEAELPDLPSA